MEYTTLGNTGLRVSRLGMGCMRLPFVGGEGPTVDRDAAVALIRAAADGGINYFDSAFAYHGGESEAILGEALESRRDKVIYATKQPFWEMHDDDTIRRNLENTLRKLRTDAIDIYLLHRVMPGDTWEEIKQREIFRQFEGFKREGLVKHIGFSYHGNYEHFREVIDEYPWEIAMVQHNMLDTAKEVTSAGVDYAAAKGLGVVIMEPLRGGGLSCMPDAVREVYNESSRDWTATEWALNYLRDKPQVGVILSGMTAPPQLTENLTTFATPVALTDDDRETITRAAAAYDSLTTNACTGCNYCIPCPAGVKIPHIFTNYNDYHRFGRNKQPRRSYFLFCTNQNANATKCTACGICVPKCPQNIDIPTELQKAHKDLFGWAE